MARSSSRRGTRRPRSCRSICATRSTGAQAPRGAQEAAREQLLGALGRLERGKPVITQARRAPRVVETVGLLHAATTNTGPAAEEFWQEVVMPLSSSARPASSRRWGRRARGRAKQGVYPLFLFLDVVPFQFKAPEEGLLGAFTDLQVPAAEFRGEPAGAA